MGGLPRAAERGGDLGGGGALLELRARGDGGGDDLRSGGVAVDTYPPYLGEHADPGTTWKVFGS